MDEKVKEIIEEVTDYKKRNILGGLPLMLEIEKIDYLLSHISNLERKLGEILRESQPKTFLDDPAEDIYTEEDGIPLKKETLMMNEKFALNIKLQNEMEILITKREGMVAENQQRVHRGESMAHDSPAFSLLNSQFTKLWEELMHNEGKLRSD